MDRTQDREPEILDSGLLAQFKPMFVGHFEREIDFYQLFLLLINRSCPIKRVELIWADDGPALRIGLRQKAVCTEEALASRCAELIENSDSEPHFCNLVSDYGRRQTETCGISDLAAAKRAGETGKPDVYRCHAGLIDIAVPVISDGRHIATLFTGQVLTEPKSRAKFQRIRRSLAGLDFIDWPTLEKAYWAIPEVSAEDIEHTVSVLEIFAEHLGNAWKRLTELARDQQRKDRELRINRKEFAHAVLDGKAGMTGTMRPLMRQLGFTRYPNLAMAISLEPEETYADPGVPFDLALTRALEAAEQVCGSLQNVCCAYMHRRGFSVFFCDEGARARSLAARILAAVSKESGMQARIGIGGAKADWRSLLDSYHEAHVALAEDAGPVAIYRERTYSSEKLSSLVAGLCRLIAERKVADARRALTALPLAANREIGRRAEHTGAQRQFYSFTLTKMALAASSFGNGSPDSVEAERELSAAATLLEVQEVFVRSGEEILRWMQSLFAGRRDKMITLACRQIQRMIEGEPPARSIDVREIAASVSISPGYLTRLFKRHTGMTFERYVMKARVDASARILLNPLESVSSAAEKCGFSDPAYFARVFRKLTGCSPTAYREDPARVVVSGRSR